MATTRGRATVKTVPTDADVDAFVAAVEHDVRRRDAQTLLALMRRATGEEPVLWGPSLIGFGTHHYAYPSGREGDTGAIGFSPRKAATTVYFNDGFETYGDELARLGPHSLGRSCLYLKDLEQVDLGVLEDMVRRSYAAVTGRTTPEGQG